MGTVLQVRDGGDPDQIVFLSTDALLFAKIAPHPLNYNLAKATAIAVVFFWNYLVNRAWTHRRIR